MPDEFYDYYMTWLWTITPKRLHEIVSIYGSPKEVFQASEKDLELLDSKEIHKLEAAKNNKALYEIWDNISKASYQFISCRDSRYPKRLLELYDYPYGIYIEGTLPLEQPMVAMVGARNCTEYGRGLAYSFARSLGMNRISVVSGLAGGIDGASHRGCLDGGGYTLGILGAGVNTIYPKENYDLYARMKQKGGILSEYPPDVRPNAILFPRRNRIISILSDFLLVVEAREKSGSLITVDFALEQGKNIGVVPGRPCDSLSTGCNRLLQQGAKCILDVEDIYEELMDTIELYQIKNRRNAIEEIRSGKVSQDLGLAPKEKMVYSCVRLEPQFVDEIVCKLELPVWESIQILAELEIKGLITQRPHHYYIRV